MLGITEIVAILLLGVKIVHPARVLGDTKLPMRLLATHPAENTFTVSCGPARWTPLWMWSTLSAMEDFDGRLNIVADPCILTQTHRGCT